MDVLIIGCGVSGLSCGIRLLEAGFSAQIWARDLPPRTTSNVAAAIWYPYKAYPEHLVVGWSAATYADFVQLAQLPETGVAQRAGMEIFPWPVEEPWWRAAVPGFRRATPSELPDGYRDGYVFEAPVIEMPVYLGYLMRRFESLGGQIAVRALTSIDEAFAQSDRVIDCAGLGARELIGDTTLLPIRGQVVRVAQVGIERFWLDDYGPSGVTYIVPRANDCILGGTADEGSEDLTPDPATAAAIIARCVALEPRLRDAEILEHKVGLRPGRPMVRLEAEQWASGKLLIHNYGHGGAGVTLSWGCAAEVLGLVEHSN
ncbi:MAG: FAD-dependent oxidoreductase [Roseiflexaceae bacterium]